MKTLELKKVEKSFGINKVLDDVNLTINKGEVLSIIGPSGSGKSTLLRCINFLEVPSSGEISIEDKKVDYSVNRIGKLNMASRFKMSKIRSKVGMVFQHFNLWTHKTVLENIIEGPVIVKKIDRKKAIEKAEELLDKVGLSDKRDEYPENLSGGQKQRIAIARSLAMEPSLMLFDEATSGLDPELVGEVLKIMVKLAEEGMTMIVVTHEMSFAERVSNRVIFMDHGKIVKEGSPNEIFRNNENPRLTSFLKNVHRE